MTDPVLRAFTESLEREDGCPITLVLASSVVVGLAVKRADFFEALRELAAQTSRAHLKRFATDTATVDEPAGDVVHLLHSVVISGGQAVDSALTAPDGHSFDSRRPPMRVRVADVQAWHFGNVFEEAR